MKSTALLIVILVLFSACHQRLQFVKVHKRHDSKELKQESRRVIETDLTNEVQMKDRNLVSPEEAEPTISQNDSDFSRQESTEEKREEVLQNKEKELNLLSEPAHFQESVSPSTSKQNKESHGSIDWMYVLLWIGLVSLYLGVFSLVIVLILALSGVVPWVWMLLPLAFGIVVIITGLSYISETGPN